MELSLNHLQPGEKAVVISVWACDLLARRLQCAGVIPGAQLRCVGRTGNGQITVLELDGTCIRLQTRDLEKIRIRFL